MTQLMGTAQMRWSPTETSDFTPRNRIEIECCSPAAVAETKIFADEKPIITPCSNGVIASAPVVGSLSDSGASNRLNGITRRAVLEKRNVDWPAILIVSIGPIG
jgi:hypothetical protein